MRFGSKVPGSTMEVRDVNMDFGYGLAFTEDSPEAYERLILDVLLGEPSLFPVNAEVERSWQILDPVLERWAEQGAPEGYPAGSWGPRRGGTRSWRAPVASGAGRDHRQHRMCEASSWRRQMIVDMPATSTQQLNRKLVRAAGTERGCWRRAGSSRSSS